MVLGILIDILVGFLLFTVVAGVFIRGLKSLFNALYRKINYGDYDSRRDRHYTRESNNPDDWAA